MKRKTAWLAGIGIALLAITAFGVATREGGSLETYKFLKGSETLFNERMAYPGATSTVARYRVFNVHRPIAEVAKQVAAELAGQGYIASTALPWSRYWYKVPKGKFAGSSACPSLILLTDGKGRLVSSLKPADTVHPTETVEGWTEVSLIEEYVPSLVERVWDRFRGPPKSAFVGPGIQTIPGRDMRKALRGMASTATRPSGHTGVKKSGGP